MSACLFPSLLRRSVLAAFATLLAACAQVPPASDRGITLLPLLSPASLGKSAQIRQLLHAAHGDQDVTLQCVISDDLQTLSMVCLTALAQRVFSVDYDGQSLKTWRAPFAPSGIDPARIVADLQFAYWPLIALESAWKDSGYQLEEPRSGLRRLRRDGHIVEETHSADSGPWPSRLWLVNFDHDYALDIETSALEP